MQQIQASVATPAQSTASYGRPRSIDRWPQPNPEAPYIAMLGGSSTLGKSVATPFPALVEAATAIPVVNLGALNGGPDVYLSDREVLNLIVRAEVAVVQLTGAETLSNPYYTVHSRRNDRFLAATPALQDLFPEVDFTEIHFARHLLQVLARTDANRFAMVARTLKANWVTRMLTLLIHLPLRRRLLWLSDSPPPERADSLDQGTGPLLVDAEMLARLRPLAGEVIIAVPSPEARAGDAVAERDVHVAGLLPTGLPGAAAHREIAALLIPEIVAQFRSRRWPLLRLLNVIAAP